MSFEGFPEEFVDFLLTLQFSNTVDLLPEYKVRYKRLITEPLTLLYNDLVPVVTSISETAETIPSRCISSMYNDMRFSRETPLKGYMYLRFREPFANRDVLGLYFDMGCDYYSYGIRIYKQTSRGMEKVRGSVIEKSRVFACELERLKASGMTIFGDMYAKDHYPNVDNQIIKGILNRKSFYIGRNCLISESVFCGRLLTEISSGYQALGCVYTLLKESLYGV